MLRELIFDGLNINDLDLREFSNLWITCDRIKVLRIRRCLDIRGEYYLKDFLLSLNAALQLDCLDMSRNSLDSSVNDSLVDTLFTAKKLNICELDLSFNNMDDYDNAILHEVYKASRAHRIMHLKLDPYMPGMISATPQMHTHRHIDSDADIDDIIRYFRHVDTEMPASHTHDNEESAILMHMHDMPFDSFKADDSSMPGDRSDLHRVNDDLMHRNADIVRLYNMIDHIDDHSVDDIRACLTAAILQMPAPLASDVDRSSKLASYCLSAAKLAVEHDDIKAWHSIDQICTIAGIEGSLAVHDDYKRCKLIAMAKICQLQADVRDTLDMIGKPRLVNDRLDSVCIRIVNYGVAGLGADLLLLIREKRNQMIREYADSRLDEGDLQIESLRGNPLLFLEINKDYSDSTKDSPFTAVEAIGVHENWLDYELLANLTRSELMKILEEELEHRQDESPTKQTKSQTSKFKRVSFMLSEPLSDVFKHMSTDSLLVQSRTVCRLRWSQGCRQVSNLNSMKSLCDSYLDSILERNTSNAAINDHSFTQFVSEHLIDSRSMMAIERSWLSDGRQAIRHLIADRLAHMQVEDDTRHTIVDMMTDDQILMSCASESKQHAYMTKIESSKFMYIGVLRSSSSELSTTPDDTKLMINAWLIAAGLSDSDNGYRVADYNTSDA